MWNIFFRAICAWSCQKEVILRQGLPEKWSHLNFFGGRMLTLKAADEISPSLLPEEEEAFQGPMLPWYWARSHGFELSCGFMPSLFGTVALPSRPSPQVCPRPFPLCVGALLVNPLPGCHGNSIAYDDCCHDFKLNFFFRRALALSRKGRAGAVCMVMSLGIPGQCWGRSRVLWCFYWNKRLETTGNCFLLNQVFFLKQKILASLKR